MWVIDEIDVIFIWIVFLIHRAHGVINHARLALSCHAIYELLYTAEQLPIYTPLQIKHQALASLQPQRLAH